MSTRRRLPLAVAGFLFWDKYASELQAAYREAGMVTDKGLRFPEYGVHPAQGSYYEVFRPWFPDGKSESFYGEQTSLAAYAASYGKPVPPRVAAPGGGIDPQPEIEQRKTAGAEKPRCHVERKGGALAEVRLGKQGAYAHFIVASETHYDSDNNVKSLGNLEPESLTLSLVHRPGDLPQLKLAIRFLEIEEQAVARIVALDQVEIDLVLADFQRSFTSESGDVATKMVTDKTRRFEIQTTFQDPRIYNGFLYDLSEGEPLQLKLIDGKNRRNGFNLQWFEPNLGESVRWAFREVRRLEAYLAARKCEASPI